VAYVYVVEQDGTISYAENGALWDEFDWKRTSR
jgi:hypothetical protein